MALAALAPAAPNLERFDVNLTLPNVDRFRGVMQRFADAGIELTGDMYRQMQAIALYQPHKDKVCAVTGAANGIGFIAANLLSLGGARAVAVMDMDPSVSTTFANQNNDGLHGYVVNITKMDQVQAAVSSFRGQFGNIDTAVLNAGIFVKERGDIHTVTEADMRKSFEVNYFGTLNCAQALAGDLSAAGKAFVAARAAALPQGETLPNDGSGIAYTERGLALVNSVERRPTLLFIGTRNVHAFSPDAMAYNNPKAAVVEMARDVSVTLGKDGVSVNILHPDGVYVGSKLWTKEALEKSAASKGKSVEQILRSGWLMSDITCMGVGLVISAVTGPNFSEFTGQQFSMDGGHLQTARL